MNFCGSEIVPSNRTEKKTKWFQNVLKMFYIFETIPEKKSRSHDLGLGNQPEDIQPFYFYLKNGNLLGP